MIECPQCGRRTGLEPPVHCSCGQVVGEEHEYRYCDCGARYSRKAGTIYCRCLKRLKWEDLYQDNPGRIRSCRSCKADIDVEFGERCPYCKAATYQQSPGYNGARTCKHFGEPTGGAIALPGCSSAKVLVHHCDLHGKCTMSKFSRRVDRPVLESLPRACAACEDFTPRG